MNRLRSIIFIILAFLSITNTNILKAQLAPYEKFVNFVSTKTSISSELVNIALVSTLVATLVGSGLILCKLEEKARKRRLLEKEEHERNLTDDDVIKEEKSRLYNYQELYGDTIIFAATHDNVMLSKTIKVNNSFPYFIPYRSKVAYAHADCVKSLKLINKRLDPNFTTNHPRNIAELQQLKNVYEQFIQELEILKNEVYECIKSSYIENILMWYVTNRAQAAKNSLEPNRYHFTYLVEDLI